MKVESTLSFWGKVFKGVVRNCCYCDVNMGDCTLVIDAGGNRIMFTLYTSVITVAVSNSFSTIKVH